MVNDKNLDVENVAFPVASFLDDLLTLDFALKSDFQTEKTLKFLTLVHDYFGREFSNQKANTVPYALALVLRKQEIFFGLFESGALDSQSDREDDEDEDDLDFKGVDDPTLLSRFDLWLDRVHFLISIPVERNENLKRDGVILLPKGNDKNPILSFVKGLLEDRSMPISLPFVFFDKDDFAVNNVFCKNLGGAMLSYLDYVQRNTLTTYLNTRIYRQLSIKDSKEIHSLVHYANKCCASLGKKQDDLDRLEFIMFSRDARVVGVSNDNVFQGIGSPDNTFFSEIGDFVGRDYVLMHRHLANLFSCVMKSAAGNGDSILYRWVSAKKGMPILDRFVPNSEIQYLFDDDTFFDSVDLLLDVNLYLSVPVQVFNFPYQESYQIVQKRDKDWYYQNISENAIDSIRELILEYVGASALSLLVLDGVASLLSDVYLFLEEKKNEKGLLDWSFKLVSAKNEDLNMIDSKLQSGDCAAVLLSKECLDNDVRFSFPEDLRNRIFSVKNLYDVLFCMSDEDMNLLVQVPYKSTPADLSNLNYRRSKANVLKIMYFNDSGNNVGVNFSLIRFGKKDI